MIALQFEWLHNCIEKLLEFASVPDEIKQELRRC